MYVGTMYVYVTNSSQLERKMQQLFLTTMYGRKAY